jgi:hypothetical protein
MSHTTADEQVDTGATVDHVDLAIRGLGEGSAGSWGSRIRRGIIRMFSTTRTSAMSHAHAPCLLLAELVLNDLGRALPVEAGRETWKAARTRDMKRGRQISSDRTRAPAFERLMPRVTRR